MDVFTSQASTFDDYCPFDDFFNNLVNLRNFCLCFQRFLTHVSLNSFLHVKNDWASPQTFYMTH